MKRSLAIALLLLSAGPSLVRAAEPRIFLVGIWPNRVRLFDEKTEEFVGEFPLRHGVVVWDSGGYSRTAHTPGYRLVYFITDRMESVEVVDPAKRSVVDEIRLSTPERRVRILGVTPVEDGKRLYLTARAVRLASDRFLAETDADVFVYDVDAREVEASFRFPDSIRFSFNPVLLASRDGKSVFAVGEDIHEISTETHEIVDTIPLSRARFAGYGPVAGELLLYEENAGSYFAAFHTVEPAQGKRMTGLLHLDLTTKRVERFEVGPQMDVGHLGLSPDGDIAFLGGTALAVVDLKSKRLLKRKEGFERGRPNTSWISSADGKKLYVSGVGDTMKVYDAERLELIDEIFLGGDAIFAPFALPRALLETQPQ